jgi:hypothetical protein
MLWKAQVEVKKYIMNERALWDQIWNRVLRTFEVRLINSKNAGAINTSSLETIGVEVSIKMHWKNFDDLMGNGLYWSTTFGL